MSMTVEEALEVFNSGCNDIYKIQVATHTAIKALEEIQALKAENAELHCKLQAQNSLFSERDSAIEAGAITRFVNWVDDNYNTEVYLKRTDEYKNIHDFYEEFMDEMQREKEEERD